MFQVSQTSRTKVRTTNSKLMTSIFISVKRMEYCLYPSFTDSRGQIPEIYKNNKYFFLLLSIIPVHWYMAYTRFNTFIEIQSSFLCTYMSHTDYSISLNM